MAAVTSLGLHHPVGVQYLIREGLLQSASESYQWLSQITKHGDVDLEEEIVWTHHCVVWSQGNSVRTVYRFDLEGEQVCQALLTSFPYPSISRSSHAKSRSNLKQDDEAEAESSSKDNANGRALVVLLKTKAHVYFLQGSSHVVDLPIQIEKAFGAPQGLILQRSTSALPSLPPTPKPLAVPHNSFFSSQQGLSSSYLQSPTLQRRQVGSQNSQADARAGEIMLDGLWRRITDSPKTNLADEDLLFALTHPFSEISAITEAAPHQNFRLSSRSKAGAGVDFISLDPGERIEYVSASDECPAESSAPQHGQLMLIVTYNQETHAITVWHAWYLKEKTLSELMKARAEQKDVRRRSSFMAASHGSMTPTVRARDGLRESMAAMSQITAKSLSKVAKQNDMVSQLNQDFEATSTQQSEKDNNRRISSLVSRGELSTVDLRSGRDPSGASFVQGRRNTSFGVPSDRRSQGFRRSRGSTPGSILSRTHLDDDMMDLDSEDGSDVNDTIAEILHQMRVTQEAVGAESVLGSLDERWRRDVVVRKIHSFDLGTIRISQEAETFQVSTIQEPAAIDSCEGERLSIFMLAHSSKRLFKLTLNVLQRPLFNIGPDSPQVAIPVIHDHNEESMASDMLKISQDRTEVMLFGQRQLRFPGSSATCQIMDSTEYRRQDPMAVLSSQSVEVVEAGKNRMLDPPATATLISAGADGTFIESDQDGLHHRRQVQLVPNDHALQKVLSMCELVLPPVAARTIRSTWFTVHQRLLNEPKLSIGTAQSHEWIATAASMFAVIRGLLDNKSSAALTVARMAARGQLHSMDGQNLRQPLNKLRSRAAWSALATLPSIGDEDRPPSSSSTLDQALPIAVSLAVEHSHIHDASSFEQDATMAAQLLLSLHIFHEEQKLSILNHTSQNSITPLIAQIGLWLNVESWTASTGCYYSFEDASTDSWSYVRSTAYKHASMEIMEQPIGVFEWLEHCLVQKSVEAYPSLTQIAQLSGEALPRSLRVQAARMTPRIDMLSKLFLQTNALTATPSATIEAMSSCGITSTVLETLPEGIATPLREAISLCSRQPSSSWPDTLLKLIDRQDLLRDSNEHTLQMPSRIEQPLHDISSACHAVELPPTPTKTREADRNAISQLIFRQDKRLVHAASLLHFNTVQVAECAKQPGWSDTHYFEQQKRVMQFVVVRMIALPAGDGMLHYDSQIPLMTERYHLPGFNSSCIMHPIGVTVTTDRAALTEEKVNWAYFHAGVSTGLKISRQATGIDTSWLVFNKPNELTNRHAGLLLALGLNGHLKNLAKWLSFKYLTPKHTMTSLGLLLGLAASKLGSMDGLTTRMLSVHVSCMLPTGAAELNVSPLVQTAGLMAIGLLYYNSEHRRMSEIMLHEIEYLEIGDPDSGPDPLRDESYRLAAGFALGFCNLGHGASLRGLHGIQLQDRLLRVAVGSRPIPAVHIFDRAIAGAVMALALIFMKTGDTAVARRIDVPDTENQYEHVRPDILTLRIMAKHIILWNSITVPHRWSDTTQAPSWISSNLPKCCKSKWQLVQSSHGQLSITDAPLYSIVTGLAWAVSLKYAGSGYESARDEILDCLDVFWTLSKRRIEGFHTHQKKFARNHLRKCIDTLALSAATVMAGTGDVKTFRYLRRMHGRTDAETPYGSHLATHMAIGILFMAGGTLTFGTSNLATASLMVSLYPLFPTDVHENAGHLQAFRHLWVFAIESRCLIVEDVDTRRPIAMPVTIDMRDATSISAKAPLLVPTLSSIRSIKTDDPAYWPVTLDFLANPAHLAAFKQDQVIRVRRCPPAESHSSAFWSTFSALSTQPERPLSMPKISSWVLARTTLAGIDKNDVQFVVPADERNSTYVDGKNTKIDDRLILRSGANSNEHDRLWDLRVLFAWMQGRAGDTSVQTRWHRKEDLQALESIIERRRKRVEQH